MMMEGNGSTPVMSTMDTTPSQTTPSLQFHDFPLSESSKQSHSGGGGIPIDNSNSVNTSWLQFENYSKYFNVTTEEVIQRIISAASIRDTFLEDLAGRTDLYGPLWVAITFAVAIFMANSAGNLFKDLGSFVDLQSLSSALSAILLYLIIMSFGGWALLCWLGADSVQIIELFTLLGYSLVIFYPVVVVSLFSIIKFIVWIAALLGALASGYFVYQNLHPVLRTSAIGTEKALLHSSIIVSVHVIFLLCIKVTFL